MSCGAAFTAVGLFWGLPRKLAQQTARLGCCHANLKNGTNERALRSRWRRSIFSVQYATAAMTKAPLLATNDLKLAGSLTPHASECPVSGQKAFCLRASARYEEPTAGDTSPRERGLVPLTQLGFARTKELSSSLGLRYNELRGSSVLRRE